MNNYQNAVEQLVQTSQQYRASIYRKQYNTTFDFESFEDAKEYLIASIDGYTEDVFLLGVSIEVFQAKEWVNTGFTLDDAKSILAGWR